jgi:hypothetical protein
MPPLTATLLLQVLVAPTVFSEIETALNSGPNGLNAKGFHATVTAVRFNANNRRRLLAGTAEVDVSVVPQAGNNNPTTTAAFNSLNSTVNDPDFRQTLSNTNPTTYSNAKGVIQTSSICFGKNSRVRLADGSAPTVAELWERFHNGEAGLVVEDVHGHQQPIKNVMRVRPGESLVVLPAGSVANNLPTAELTLTASHLVRLPDGTVRSAEELAEQLHIQQVPKLEVVYHIETEEWTFLSVHGLGCESAARSHKQYLKRAAAHESGLRPDPSCNNELGSLD